LAPLILLAVLQTTIQENGVPRSVREIAPTFPLCHPEQREGSAFLLLPDRRSPVADNWSLLPPELPPPPGRFCEVCKNKGFAGASALPFSCLLIADRWLLVADNVLIWMRTVRAEGERAGDLRSADGLVPNIHNLSYHTIYQLSISIYEILVPKL
jgi:hypothetical protein